jgi:serine/threonine protein kinase
VFCQVLLALHYCHTPALGRGVILHRDIKPENGELSPLSGGRHVKAAAQVRNPVYTNPLPINKLMQSMLSVQPVLVAADGAVRVSDFGLAKPMRGQVFATSNVGVSPSCQLTATYGTGQLTPPKRVCSDSRLYGSRTSLFCFFAKMQDQRVILCLLGRKQLADASLPPVKCD